MPIESTAGSPSKNQGNTMEDFIASHSAELMSGNNDNTPKKPLIAVLEDNKVMLLTFKKQVGANAPIAYDSGQYQPNEKPQVLQDYQRQLEQNDMPYQVFVLDYEVGSHNPEYQDGMDIAEELSYTAKQHGEDPIFFFNSSQKSNNDNMAKAVQTHLPNAEIYTNTLNNDNQKEEGDKLAFTKKLDDLVAKAQNKLDARQQQSSQSTQPEPAEQQQSQVRRGPGSSSS